MLPPAELRARVLLAARREPAAPRKSVRRRNAVVLISACVVPVLLFLAVGGVREAPRPTGLVLQTSLGAAAIASVVTIVALSRGRSTLGRASVWFLGVTMAAPIALFAWKLATSAQFHDMMLRWPERVGFRCLWLSCALAAWPLAALVLTRKGSDPVHPALTGAAIGSSVGAAVWVLVDLSCPVAYVPHLLFGHVLPLIVITASGAALGSRFIALRAR
jgi:hypothetical protein